MCIVLLSSSFWLCLSEFRSKKTFKNNWRRPGQEAVQRVVPHWVSQLFLIFLDRNSLRHNQNDTKIRSFPVSPSVCFWQTRFIQTLWGSSNSWNDQLTIFIGDDRITRVPVDSLTPRWCGICEENLIPVRQCKQLASGSPLSESRVSTTSVYASVSQFVFLFCFPHVW